MRKTDDFSSHDTLKDAIDFVIHHSPIPPKAQAAELNVPLSLFYGYADHAQPDHYPARLIVPHARCTGNPAVLQFLNHQLGYVGVRLSELRGATDAPQQLGLFQRTMLAIVREMGEAAATIERSLKDGKLTEREARACRKECRDLIDQAVLLHEQLKAAEESLR